MFGLKFALRFGGHWPLSAPYSDRGGGREKKENRGQQKEKKEVNINSKCGQLKRIQIWAKLDLPGDIHFSTSI